MEEEMMKSHMCKAREKARSETVAMSKESHMVSKLKPKIRIVHIFAPEIIQTDVANFRELVQKLTGKPAKGCGGGGKQKVGSRKRDKPEAQKPCIDVKKVTSYWESEDNELEEGLWVGESNYSSSGFFGGLGDLDGFIHGGLSDFSLTSSAHMDALGETTVS